MTNNKFLFQDVTITYARTPHDWLWAERQSDRYLSPDRVKNFPLTVQTGCGAHPASYPTGTGALSLGVKHQGLQAYHSPPTSAEVKKMWVYTSTPRTSSSLSTIKPLPYT
jgi:hypothetical protein